MEVSPAASSENQFPSDHSGNPEGSFTLQGTRYELSMTHTLCIDFALQGARLASSCENSKKLRGLGKCACVWPRKFEPGVLYLITSLGQGTASDTADLLLNDPARKKWNRKWIIWPAVHNMRIRIN